MGAAYLSAFFGNYGAILARTPDALSLILAVIAGASAYGVVATLCHDAFHASMSRRPWVNRAILHGGFMLIGISGALWGHRHLKDHHMFPNVEGSDIDADAS